MKYAADGVTPLTTVVRRLLKAKSQILAHPEQYDQTNFGGDDSCGTVGCIAGWLDLEENGEQIHRQGGVQERALRLLGLGSHFFSNVWLFKASLVSKAGGDKRRRAALAAGFIDQYIEEITLDAEERERRTR